jgi:hypothetical protein
VFIPGGFPSATYVSRSHLSIESDLATWIDGAHTTLLSVSGITKTGKTVLLRRFLREAMWFSGGAIATADEFWVAVCEALEIFTDHELTAENGTTNAAEGALEVGGVIAKGSVGASHAVEGSRGVTRARQQTPKNAARKALAEQRPFVVIDDFHYIPSDEQRKIVLGLKDLVFEGLPVIVAAVPHRAYDAVRVEKEMTGRVEPLEVGNWIEDDLMEIAERGFRELHFEDSDKQIAERLANESFGSPHLMQTHCLAISRDAVGSGVDDSGAVVLKAPDWRPFFAAQAAATSKTAFDLLKQGPRQRTDRIARKLKTGVEADIYGAVLAEIESTGPKTQLTYEEVRNALRNVLESELPQRHEITNVLDQLTIIARDKIEGEPVLEYDPE